MESRCVQKRRKTTTKACLRCHRRKQRCVGFPACTNCRAAKIACSRDSTPLMRRLAGLSKEELLNKIEALEERLSTEKSADSQEAPSTLPGRRLSTTSSLSTFSNQHLGTDYDNVEDFAVASEDVRYPTCSPEPRASEGPILDSSTKAARIDSTGFELLTTYLESLHRRVPFCVYVELLSTHKDPLHGSPMALFRLHMACAIGAAIRQLTGTSTSHHPEQYYAQAFAVRNSAEKKDLVEDTEVLLWTVLYKLRSSFSSDVWYTIGLAVRTAIEAGLHRESTHEGVDATTADMRRCLFWAVYVIERNICWALKRPFSLADHDIDVKLPSPATHPTHLDEEHRERDSHRPLDLNVFIATIRLARLNSRAYSQIYRVDDQKSSSRPLLDDLFQFEASLPKCSAPDWDFLQLHVKNAIRIHIEPFLPRLLPSDPLIRSCLDACGSVCQLFKRLRLNRSLGYSFTMVNSVFVAGITICYIIFKNPSLWTPSRANQLRACSSTLFAAAERNSAVRKYCDVLETIIEAVMGHVEQISNPDTELETPTVSSDGQSPIASPSKGQSPQDAFDKLSRTFNESNFEFPSHSYPTYRVEPAKASDCSTAHSMPGVSCLDFSEHDFSTFNVWDFIGSFDEGGSTDLFSGQFSQG